MIDAFEDAFHARDARSGLPDPDKDPQFYEAVNSRRIVAFFIDTVISLALCTVVWIVVMVLTLGFGILLSGLIWMATAFAYRVFTLGSGQSATVGMRMTGIEIRNLRGDPLTYGEAAIHTILFMMALSFIFPQLISLLMAQGSSRGRLLHDIPLGSTAVNRPL